jgi:hypothetical protein
MTLMKEFNQLIMKLLLAFACIVAASVASRAQDEPQGMQDPKVQERIKALRVAYITEKLGLSAEQAEKFWPVYREYADKQNAIRDEFRLAAKGIDPKNITHEEQQRLLELKHKIKQQELDLEKDYSTRLIRVISAQQLMNLGKAERDFNILIREQIQQRRMQQERRENLRENQRLRQRNN